MIRHLMTFFVLLLKNDFRTFKENIFCDWLLKLSISELLDSLHEIDEKQLLTDPECVALNKNFRKYCFPDLLICQLLNVSLYWFIADR